MLWYKGIPKQETKSYGEIAISGIPYLFGIIVCQECWWWLEEEMKSMEQGDFHISKDPVDNNIVRWPWYSHEFINNVYYIGDVWLSDCDLQNTSN